MISKNLWMRDKDYEFFHYLHTVKVALLEQINRDVYGYQKPNTLRKRIQKFESLGLVRCYSHPAYHPRKIMSLTPKGFDQFLSDGTRIRMELASGSIAHDIDLVDVRSCFLQNQNVVEYLTENCLQSYPLYRDSDEFYPFAAVRSDAVAVVRFPEGDVRFAVEYEASSKYSSRCLDRFRRYYRSQEIAFVLYVCKTEKLMKELMRREKRLAEGMTPKLFFKTLTDLKTDSSMTFSNRLGEMLVIKLS